MGTKQFVVLALLSVATVSQALAQTSRSVIIEGIPLSVVYTAKPYEASFSNISIVLLVDGKPRIASANTSSPGVAQLTHLVAMLEAEISDGDHESIIIEGDEYTPAAPDAVYPQPIFVRLRRIEVEGYSWGTLYLQ